MEFLKKLDKNTILGGIAVVGVVILAGLIFVNNNGGGFNISQAFGQSNDKIAQKAVDYINDNGLAGEPATLVSSSAESGLIKMKIKIGESEFDSYITKDGKYLFPQAIDISGAVDNSAPAASNNPPSEEEKQQAAASIQKTDSPMLEAYVVSNCPYGVQMQRAMAEAVRTLPELSKYIKVRYIGDILNGKVTAMHGDAEAQENLKQICIRDEQPEKYWEYVSCYMKAGDSEGCETSTGVNSSKLDSCTSTASKGLVYAKADFDLSSQYQAIASPTLIVNGGEASEFSFGGRTADAIKSAVCAGFINQPEFCLTTLSTASAAVSFSESYEGAGNSGSAAGCE